MAPGPHTNIKTSTLHDKYKNMIETFPEWDYASTRKLIHYKKTYKSSRWSLEAYINTPNHVFSTVSNYV